jgi:predicted Zn-dependent peptidase
MTPGPAAPVTELVRAVDLPYERFTLANGLRVIVHEDRKAPLVHVSLWYSAGSKDEKPGKTGLAHLFEHLAPPDGGFDWFKHMQAFGATDHNASTWYDRTNYFVTVPTGALEATLFLKGNRAGQVFGSFGQETLTTQIGVVQNELRQDDNDPYDGPVGRARIKALFPEGHPYGHPNGGSLADVGSATLADVHKWRREKFGPNNAVLVLAGDIDAATARPLVERYFGEIPRGPLHKPAIASVPTLKAPIQEVIKGKVGKTRLYRYWTGPGLLHPDAIPLEASAGVLGGVTSSRLNNALVRGDQTAVMTYASQTTFQGVSIYQIGVDVKPGADVDAVSRRLDSIIADFIAEGPTEEEVRRVATAKVAARIRELEKLGNFTGKASALAEGELFAKDPEHYKKRLLAYSTMTPARVRAAVQKWLSRPVYALRLEPGEREASNEESPAPAKPVAAVVKTAADRPVARKSRVDRTKLPALGAIGDVDFPGVERAKLSNDVEVILARRTAMPLVQVAVEFNAGFSADPQGKAGLQKFVASMLDEGTATRSALQLAEEKERLGATLEASASVDRTNARLSALKPNLAPSLDLLADRGILTEFHSPAPGSARRSRQSHAMSCSPRIGNGSGRTTLKYS